MKKNPAVEQVRVSLKDGMTILDLKPGNTATVAELRRIIKNNGFVSKEATATARGTVSADQKTFTVAGTNEQLLFPQQPNAQATIGGLWSRHLRNREPLEPRCRPEGAPDAATPARFERVSFNDTGRDRGHLSPPKTATDDPNSQYPAASAPCRRGSGLTRIATGRAADGNAVGRLPGLPAPTDCYGN